MCECVCEAYHLDCSNDVEKVCFLDKKAFAFERKCSCELCTEPCKWTVCVHRSTQEQLCYVSTPVALNLICLAKDL